MRWQQEFLLCEGDFYGSCLLDLFVFADTEMHIAASTAGMILLILIIRIRLFVAKLK